MFDEIVILLLSPILAFQALRVRRTALILPEAAGPRSGRAGNGPVLRLLVVGDSSAAGVGADTQADALTGRIVDALAKKFTVEWRLVAKTGATTADTVARLINASAEPCDVVVTALGVNDVTHAVRQRQWVDSTQRLWALLRSRFGAKQIVVSGLPPMQKFPLLPQPLRWVLGRRAAKFDAAVRCMAGAAPDCTYLLAEVSDTGSEMAADGFHPGPELYAEWARRVVAAISV